MKSGLHTTMSHLKGRWIVTDKSSQSTQNRGKIMLCVRWDFWSIIYLNFLKRNEIFNAHLYFQQMQRVHKGLIRKCPMFVNRGKCFSDPPQGHIQCYSQQWKVLNSVGLLYPNRHIHLTVHQPTHTFFNPCILSGGNKNFISQNPVQELVETFLASKPA